jgi:DNA-binding transcriptional LysR family regulator
MTPMDIHHLKVFVSVYKNRSFSKASEELHITQPTISSHIRDLEEELDTRLFDRKGRLVVLPTEEAKVLYLHAVDAIEKINGIKTAISRFKEEIKGRITIGESTIPGAYIIPAFASRFKKKHPSVSFEILIGDSKGITTMLMDHQILIGIVGARMSQRGVNYEPFMEDELILAAPPGFTGKKTVTFQELTRIPFLLREEGSGTRKTMEKHLAEKGVSVNDLNITGILGSTDSIKEAVMTGLGASILSRLAIKKELRSGALTKIKIKGLNIKRSFYIATHKRRTLPMHYQAFAKYLKAKA